MASCPLLPKTPHVAVPPRQGPAPVPPGRPLCSSSSSKTALPAFPPRRGLLPSVFSFVLQSSRLVGFSSVGLDKRTAAPGSIQPPPPECPQRPSEYEPRPLLGPGPTNLPSISALAPRTCLRGSALARTSPGRGADLCYEGTRCPLSPSGSLAGLATKSTEDRRTGGKPRSATGGSPPGQVQPFVAGAQGHPTERTLTLLLEEALSRPRCSSVYF